MDEQVRAHVAAYNKAQGYATDDATIIETITEASYEHQVYAELISRRHWWNIVFRVVEVGGMLIGYDDAETTGDIGPSETGWDLDPSTICRVRPVEKTVTAYERVEVEQGKEQVE